MKKRKIVEIYATEDLENKEVNFEVKRMEDTMVSNAMMQMIHEIFMEKNPNGTKVNYEEEDE